MSNATDSTTTSGLVPTEGLTHAIHLGNSDLPEVALGDGSTVQLLQVDLNAGLWVIRAKFQPGYQVTKHYHTGSVNAVTLAGSWYYKEYPEFVNTAGSFLYEPAHSVHTLMVGADNTEVTDVWFAINGSNVNMDDDGNIVGITDAQSILAFYQSKCEALGLDCSALIVNGSQA
ncbi:MAG: 2,4'-dihydroxyacetophenone dioxygenase [Candidatus Poriferisodalaceae bacterium]|jgi:2,4'-dihydroxyacetophenone dioxygenase